jgi:hypothetical protein
VRQTLLQPTRVLGGAALQRAVLNEAYEARRLGVRYHADRDECRKDATVLPAGADFPAGADDVRNPCRYVPREIPVVRDAIFLGHEYADIATEDLLWAVAEQLLGRATERLNTAQMVDHDDRVDGGVQQRLQLVRRPRGGRHDGTH